MDRTPEPLTSREHRLLVELVGRNAPALLSLATGAVNRRWLSDEETAALVQVALDEFLARLGPGGEPNRKDIAPHDLQGLLEKQRRGFWD